MNPPRIARNGDSFDRALVRAGRAEAPARGAEERALAALGLSAGLAASSVAAVRAKALSPGLWGWPLKALAVTLVLGAGAAGAWKASRPSTFVAFAPVPRAVAPIARASVSVASMAAPIVWGAPGTAAIAPRVALGAAEVPAGASIARDDRRAAASSVANGATPALAIEDSVPREAALATPNVRDFEPSPPAAHARPVHATALSSEIALVQQAARALASGDAAAALGLLDTYRRACPGGVLVEEAAALRVQALAQSGRTGEAKALAALLLDAHPHGVLAARLHAVLEGRPAPTRP